MTVRSLLAKGAFPIILLAAAAVISAQTGPPVEPLAADQPMPVAERPSLPEGMHMAPANVLKGTEAMVRPTPIIYPRCTVAIQDSCISTSAGVNVKLMAQPKGALRRRN